MTQTDDLKTGSFVTPMLVGAAIGLAVISFFISSAEVNPAWGKFWMIRPLMITPLAGSMGGLFYYFMSSLSAKGRLNKILAMGVSALAFFVALWLGIVLGLDGTLWD